MEEILKTHPRWVNAAELLQLCGRTNTEDGKRLLRKLASASDWIVSGPGSPGYKHASHCTQDELAHYKNALISQGKDMIQRGLKIGKMAHRLIG
jgi:hypothetical protein